MPTFETIVEVRASAEQAWAMLSGVESWPQWLPTVSRVEALDATPLRVGGRYRVAQPKLRPTVWTVSVVEAGRRFEWRARSPGVVLVADHLIESMGPAISRVTLRFEFSGPLGALLGVVFGSLTRNYLNQEAQALRLRAEKAH